MKQLIITTTLFLTFILVSQAKSQPLFFFHANKELREQQEKERNGLREKHKIEIKEARERYLKEKQEKKEQTKKVNSIKEKVTKESTKNKKIARDLIWERKKEVQKTTLADKLVEIISNENDPLFIRQAEVINARTEFLKIKNVESNYKIEVKNQTPKIINTVLIVWERKIPYDESLTIAKQTKVSKPLVPYEERVIEYNDLNSRREGESYKVKIANITFEDGTQWKNPF